MKTIRFSAAAAAAMAVLSAAHAQSSVTIYGRADATVGRPLGSDTLVVRNGTGSRLGFRGQEDLGGGLAAFFTLEHRFNIDTGAQTEALRYFRQSYVGLRSNRWGTLLLGRDYTPAYIDVMVPADPFGHGTVASLLTIHTGGISSLRTDDQFKYSLPIGPVKATAMVSIDRNTPPMAPYPQRPVSLSLVYDGKPLRVAYGYENPGANRDFWHALTASYDFGVASVRAFYGTGHFNTGAERQSWSLAGVIPAGAAGQVLVAHGRLKEDSVAGTLQSITSIGYYHALSKRTTIYADIAHDSEATKRKTGFDVGLRHSF